MARRRKINLPPIQTRAKQTLTLDGFRGMNDIDHPTTLKDDILTNIVNGWVKNGQIEKRLGSVLDYGYLTVKHTEEFTATTQKDTTNTTGDWTTDGTANLLTNTTAAVDTSTSDDSLGLHDGILYRHSVISSTGIIVITYQSGSGIKAKKSADKGVTWTNLAGGAGATTIDTTTLAKWSIVIDSSNHIHIGYYLLVGGFGSVYYRKLTYSGGSWTVGASSSVVTGGGGVHYYFQGITLTSAGVIWVAYKYVSKNDLLDIKSSTDGLTWSSGTNIYTTSNTIQVADLILNNDQPMAIYYLLEINSLQSEEYDGSVWGEAKTIGNFYNYQFSSCCRANNDIWLTTRTNSSTIGIYNYNGTTWSQNTTISVGTSTLGYQVTTDGTNIWIIWVKYIASNSYDLYFKAYNGSTWGDNTAITTDHVYNRYVNTPETLNSQTILPIFWLTETSSPYNIKSQVVQLSGIIQSIGYDSTTGSQVYTGMVTSTPGTGGTITTQYADSTDNSSFGSFTSDISTLSKRYIKFKSTLTTTNLTTSPSIDKIEITYGGLMIVGLHTFTKNDGVAYMVAIAGTNFYVLEGSTFMNIKSNLTTGLRTTADTFGNHLVISNGTNAVMRFNGKVTEGTISMTQSDATITGSGTHWNTVSNDNQLVAGGKIKLFDGNWYTIDTITDDTHLEITVVYPGANASGKTYEAYAVNTLTGSPNTGKYIRTHKDRLFITGNSTYPTRLYYSAVADDTSWPATNFIDVNTNDGQINTGLVPFKDTLAIGKYDSQGIKKSVQGLFGAQVSEFTIRELTREFGFLSQQSVAIGPNYLYFIDRSGLIQTNLVNFTRIDNRGDSKIENVVKNWSQQYLQNSAAIYFDNGVYFSVPSSGAYNNLLIFYNEITRSLVKHSGINISLFTIYPYSNSPVLYFGDAAANSAVFRWLAGYTDNGQYITLTIETKEFDFKSYFLNKSIKYLYAMTDTVTSAYNLTAYYALNGATTYTQLSEAMSSTSTTGDNFKRWVLPGLSGSSVRFKIVDSNNSNPVNLVKIAIVSVEKKLRVV